MKGVTNLSVTHLKWIQKGFSLIELMVVVVIIGILGALAIPAYSDYIVRARVTEMIYLAQPTKMAITEALINGTAKESIADVAALGLEPIRDQKTVKSIEIARGVITITGNGKALGLPNPEAPFQITLDPTFTGGIIGWKCTTPTPAMKHYVPHECRS